MTQDTHSPEKKTEKQKRQTNEKSFQPEGDIFIKDKNYFGVVPNTISWNNPFKINKKIKRFYLDKLKDFSPVVKAYESEERTIGFKIKKAKIWNRKQESKLALELKMAQRTALQRSSG